jgi:hypothetical protein
MESTNFWLKMIYTQNFCYNLSTAVALVNTEKTEFKKQLLCRSRAMEMRRLGVGPARFSLAAAE